MDQEFKKFVAAGMNKAKSLGVSDVEFYIVKNKALELEVKGGQIQDTKLAESQGIGVRVIKEQRLGFSCSSDFSTTALDKMLVQAVTNASYNDRDEANVLPCEQQNYRTFDIYDPTIGQRSLADKKAMAIATEDAALAADSRVLRVERAGYEEGESQIWIANSNGLNGYQQGTYCGVYALALGSDGSAQQSGHGMDVAIRYGQVSPEKAGKMAARRAVHLLGAKQVKTQTAALVLEPYVAAQLLGIIASSFSGEAMLKARSMFMGKLGSPIASEHITLIDDGTLTDGLGTASFDGEGVCCSRTVLVEDGVLQNLLYDTHTARKAGTESTGNGLRGSYKGTPGICTTNYYLAPGTVSEQQMISQAERGLYVTEILGAHTANAISGDFSLGASGIWIEKGRLVGPVRGLTIAGNFKELLLKVECVADNLTFYGTSGAPSILVSGMTISGE